MAITINDGTIRPGREFLDDVIDKPPAPRSPLGPSPGALRGEKIGEIRRRP